MADETRLDQTIPGGKYLAADGETYVDAWGTPIQRDAASQPDEQPAAAAADEKPARTTTVKKGS